MKILLSSVASREVRVNGDTRYVIVERDCRAVLIKKAIFLDLSLSM